MARKPSDFAHTRYFAGTRGLDMVSASGTLEHAREMASARAKLNPYHRSAVVYQLESGGFQPVETVYSDGTAQLALPLKVRFV